MIKDVISSQNGSQDGSDVGNELAEEMDKLQVGKNDDHFINLCPNSYLYLIRMGQRSPLQTFVQNIEGALQSQPSRQTSQASLKSLARKQRNLYQRRTEGQMVILKLMVLTAWRGS